MSELSGTNRRQSYPLLAVLKFTFAVPKFRKLTFQCIFFLLLPFSFNPTPIFLTYFTGWDVLSCQCGTGLLDFTCRLFSLCCGSFLHWDIPLVPPLRHEAVTVVSSFISVYIFFSWWRLPIILGYFILKKTIRLLDFSISARFFSKSRRRSSLLPLGEDLASVHELLSQARLPLNI